MTVANNTSLFSTILLVFLAFFPVDRPEISHMNTPQKLPHSYEEALTHLEYTNTLAPAVSLPWSKSL